MGYPEPTKATKRFLRDTFNDPRFNIALRRSTTEWVLIYDEPAPPGSDEPEGTMSQIHEWYSGGEKLAVIHRYRRPDGSIGASGLLDPHSLLIDDKLYFDP